LKCSFCHRWQIKDKEDDTAKSLAVIDKIAEAGIACIFFSGGEPLLRKDLESLAEHARQKGLVLTLTTNGTLLTKERAKKLGEYFASIAVSLDGFEETHDQIRGVKGTYKKAMKAIYLLKENSTKAKIGINFTLCKTNSAEMIPLFTELRGIIDFASFAPVNPYPPSNDAMIPLHDIDDMITSLLVLKKEKPSNVILPHQYIRTLQQYYALELEKKCDTCVLYCCVDWNGNLWLCSVYEHPIGSLHEAPLGQIIRGKKAEITELVNKCPGCMTTCTMLPSLLYEKSFLSGIALGTAMSWLKIR
jgi:MoaA/NifB/PqqE/SkfB family radical SAM enzyme